MAGLAVAALAYADTVTLNGNTYTLPDHPRLYLDGPSGPWTARVKDPGSGVAPRATDSNPAFVAMKNAMRSCVSTSPPCASFGGVGAEDFVALAALDWYMDNSQTNSLTAAKYWINNFEDHWQSGSSIAFQFAALPSVTYGGISSWSDWPSQSLDRWAMAYSLIRSELSAGERSDFAAKVFNDVAYGYGDDCDPQLQIESGAVVNYAGGSATTVTGSGFAGLTAGRLIGVRPNSTFATSAGWGFIASVDSDEQITLTTPLKSWSGGNWGTVVSGGTIWERKPWTSTTCGARWVMGMHEYHPRSAMAGYASTTTTNAIDADDTTITVASAAGLPPEGESYYAWIHTNEVVLVTARTGTTLTVTRGCYFSQPCQSWSSGRTFVVSKYVPRGGTSEWGHNLVVTKVLGALSTALALVGDHADAEAAADAAYQTWLLIKAQDKDMWTGLQQSGVSTYGPGRQMTQVLKIAAMLENLSGSPSVSELGGDWLKNLVYYTLYYSRPDDAKLFVPWGQGDIADSATFDSQVWIPIFLGLYAGTTEAEYLNYWMRTGTGQYTSGNLTSGANERHIPFAMMFVDDSETETGYTSLPLQRAFATSDGDSTKAIGGWISRTAWNSSTATQVRASAKSVYYTTDHIGSGKPASYTIRIGSSAMLIENGSKDTGDGLNSNMPFFGTSANLKSTGSQRVNITRSGADNTHYAYVRISATDAYATAQNVTRAIRDVLHVKTAGQQTYVVVYDNLATSSGKKIGTNLWYDRTSGVGTMTDATIPSLVWTGASTRLSTAVVLPSGTGVFATATSPTNAHGVELCASADGSTCNTSATAMETLVVHRPSTNTSDTMPTVGTITVDSDYVAVQIEDATRPVVVALAKTSSQTTGSMTTTHSGSALVLVEGLTSGPYTLSRNATPVCEDVAVGADGVLACPGVASGNLTWAQGTPVDPLTITTSSLPPGTVGTAYSAQLAATGGTGGNTWDISSGTICTGLSLSSSGAITGTPTTPQTCAVTYRVTDSAMSTDTQELSIIISAAPSPGLRSLIQGRVIVNGRI